jgi:2'-hydroxyisoflavone reductase
MSTRRTFLKHGAALAAAVATAGPLAALPPAAPRARAPLSLLILGGTGFIGPHLVRLAVSRGHRVTIFTRGRRQTELPAEVERLVGDRNGQLDALKGRRWDAVVDDSATNPDWVRQSAELLRDAVGQYLFTSSTGVYYPYLTPGVDEATAPRLEADDPKDGSATYGVNKARCEQEVQRVYGSARATVVRPTYIVGPGDYTDRFTYWPVRLARGGEVLAPGRPTDPVQFIDVRDLAAFVLGLLEQKRGGTYNAAGPARAMTMPAFLEAARRAVAPEGTRLVWVDDHDFLAEHQIEAAIPWAMPRGNNAHMMAIGNARALAAGLALRPLEETVRDTLAWWQTLPEPRRAQARFAITPAQEATALAAWHARRR